jgi:hypothetical protein
VLSLSAVEALAHNEKWTGRQRKLIERLAAELEETAKSDIEQLEVADALRKSLFRLSVRQAVKRLLADLGLSGCQKEWDRVYRLRSGMFHGTITFDEHEAHTLANDAIALCGRIILTVAQSTGVTMPAATSEYYPAVASGHALSSAPA